MSSSMLIAADAPKPIGPYSHAASTTGELVFLSGQLPVDPETDIFVTGGVAEQTHRVFENLRLVLAASGLGFDDVVKVNVFVTDMADFPEVNSVYETIFVADPPARSTVAVAGLPMGARVEIEMIAARAER